jgi:hypothetical protein
MPRNLLSRSLLGGIALTLLLLAGCGGKKTVPLKGKLVLPQGFTVAQNDSVQIVFVPEGAAPGPGNPQPVAVYNPSDSTFVVTAGKASGVPPGRYKIAVQITGYPGGADAQRAKVLEGINGAYDQKASKMTYEVAPEGEQSITIDLGQGTVTKG